MIGFRLEALHRNGVPMLCPVFSGLSDGLLLVVRCLPDQPWRFRESATSFLIQF